MKWFWEIVESYSDEMRARLLQFVTGSSRVPLQGFKALQGRSHSSGFVNTHASEDVVFNCIFLLPFPQGRRERRDPVCSRSTRSRHRRRTCPRRTRASTASTSLPTNPKRECTRNSLRPWRRRADSPSSDERLRSFNPFLAGGRVNIHPELLVLCETGRNTMHALWSHEACSHWAKFLCWPTPMFGLLLSMK